MRVARIEWPDDMTESEREAVPELERRVRDLLGPLNGGGRSNSVAFETLDEQLWRDTRSGAIYAIAGRLRIVTDDESVLSGGIRYMGVRVRFTWTKLERDRRDAERRAREREESERARRGVQIAARPLGRPLRVDPPELEAFGVVVRVNGAHCDIRRPNGAIVLIAFEGALAPGDLVEFTPGSYGQTVRAMRDPDRIREAFGLQTEEAAYADLTVSRHELEEATRGDLDLMTERITEVERALNLGLERQIDELTKAGVVATAERVPSGAERVATVVGLREANGPRAATIATLDTGEQVTLAGGAAAPTLAIGSRVRIGADGLARPIVLRAFTESGVRSMGIGASSNPFAIGTFADLDAQHMALVQSIARQTTMTAAEVLEAYVAKVRDGVSTASVKVRDRAALLELFADFRPGDRLYAFKAATFPSSSARPQFRHEIPAGSLEEALQEAARARGRAALQLLARMLIVALQAKERAREGVELFYAFTFAALRVWAANPSPLELDIAYAPFGVDTSPAEDATALRFALLEIEIDK